MVSLQHDVKSAIRRWRQQWMTAIVVSITLGAGVGICSAVYGLFDILQFRMPGVRNGDEVVRLSYVANYIDYFYISRNVTSLDVAAYTRVRLTRGGDIAGGAVRVECVTDRFFSILGATPRIGRTFMPGDQDAAQGGVVVSERFWKTQLRGDAGSIGSAIDMGGRKFVVIGVTAGQFRGIEIEAVDAWILLNESPELCSFTGENMLAVATGSWLTTLGRIMPGHSFDEAQAEVERLRPSPSVGRRTSTGSVQRVSEFRHLRSRRTHTTATWLAAGGLALLLVASTNVGGVFLVAATGRRRELLTRVALGATPGRVRRQLLCEHICLLMLGLPVAMAVYAAATTVLNDYLSLTVAEPVWIDTRGYLMTLVVGAVAIIVATAPALRINLDDGLSAQRQIGSSRSHTLSQHALIAAQTALAVVLVVCCGLFLRSVRNALSDIGYEIQPLLVANVDVDKRVADADAVRAVFEEAAAQIARIRGVDVVSVTSHPPLPNAGTLDVMMVQSRTTAKMAYMNAVSGDYFRGVGSTVIEGREFNAGDTASGRPVAIVSRRLADALFPDGDILTTCVTLKGWPCLAIVGVVSNRRFTSLTTVDDEVFVPMDQARVYAKSMLPKAIVVRSAASAEGVRAPTVAVLADRRIAVTRADVVTASELAAEQTRIWRVSGILLGVCSALALCLAAIGIYWMLALSVRQRTPEIGVRIAIGAGALSIIGVICRRSMSTLAVGWLCGALASVAMGRYLSSALYGVQSSDWSVLVASAGVLVTAGLVGCAVPAIRACGVDPVRALRES